MRGSPSPGLRSSLDDFEPLVPLRLALTLLAGIALGGIVAGLVLPSALPEMTATLLGDEPKAYWYLSRSSGIVAYLMLWLSAALGLLLTNRLARLWPGGPAAADLHQFASLLALALVLFHTLILLGDRYANYRLDQLLVPFAASVHEPFWVGLGQLAFYLALPVTVSFYARSVIGARGWRLIHYASFGVVALALAHGVGAGTDTRTPAVLALYVVTGSALVFLTSYRVLTSLGRGRSARAPSALRPRPIPR